MNLYTITVVTALFASIAVPGCGNGVADDPLTGTWSNTACFGSSSMPVDVASCTVELSFSDGLDIQLKARWISLAATAVNPGCTTTRIVQGQTWSADHTAGTFTVEGQGDATIERSDCVNAEDNQSAVATTDIGIPGGDTTYTISGSTLKVTSGPLQGTYSR